MQNVNLLFKKECKINDRISVMIPTVGEIVDNEDTYYELVFALTAMPIDSMVQLDEIGIDYTTINEYELFLLLFPGLKDRDTSMVFGDLDLSKFEMGINEQNGNIVLVDSENDIVIDRAIHGQISSILRKIHNIEKDTRKPANEEARKFLLERARTKLRRKRNKPRESMLEPLIISMVNTEQFKYDFNGVRDMSIYQFNESVRQVIHKIDYEHRMSGVYAGTIDAKGLSQDDLNWLKHK